MPNRRIKPISIRAVLPVLAVVSILVLPTGVAAKPATAPGVWMLRDPGCGGQHIARHPRHFSLTCDPISWVEKVHWNTWGGTKARATGTINIADLKHGSSVADSPRLRFAASIVASDVFICGRHRLYRHVRIHYREKGRRRLASLPPPFACPEKTRNRNPVSFLSPDRKVWCGYDSIINHVSCGTYPKPPTRSAVMDGRGRVELCEVLQLEYPGESKVPLTCYQNWPAPHDGTPILGYGQHSDIGSFRCTSAMDGITCVKVSGAGKGHGFRVNKDEAVELNA